MMSTHKGGWEGVLKNCHVFVDFVILNIRSIVHFCGSLVGHFLWTSYMGDPKDNNNTNKTNVWNQNGSNNPKILNSIIRQTVT